MCKQRPSKISHIAEVAKSNKKYKFTSLMNIIDEEFLMLSYKELNKRAASGVDGVTIEGYGKDIERNINELAKRIKDGTYKPLPVRRVYIPKPGKKEGRPLGIPSLEDKIVQMAIKIILEAIFELQFLSSSHGFRPNLGCHTAIKQLREAIWSKPINHVVEVDIEKFFDTVTHAWLLRCLEMRISDPLFLRLIGKFLKAGVMEAGHWKASDKGCPQGGIISPILSNIYLHYILDLWFEKVFKPKAKGYNELIRYADDFVVVCESEADADLFLKELESRFDKFNLAISKEKTKKIEFGRKAWNKAKLFKQNRVKTFNFLGFTQYCSKTRNGYFVVKHKTAKESFRRKLKGINQWLKENRNRMKWEKIWNLIKAKLTGHYNYFGVSGNSRSLQKYYHKVIRLLFKWGNQRSQMQSMKWEKFKKYLKWNPLPKPKITCPLW